MARADRGELPFFALRAHIMERMPKPSLLIIKTGSSVREAGERFGDFDQWFVNSIGPERFEFRVVSVHQGERLPEHQDGLAGAIITGSPAMVSHRHEWSETSAAWLAEAHADGLPMLGVCYGHQLLAHALGGRVGPNPHGRRMGSLEVEIVDRDDSLLGSFAPTRFFQSTHVEAVLEPPKQARVIARGEGDDHHALYFGNSSWGLQFHPEFDVDIMDCYIRSRRSVLTGEGIYADRVLDSLRPTPEGKKVLQRFAELVEQTG
ncbi:MAG: glutamine amidotransferase, partial [Wenzhouxiangella sp.]